MNIETISAIEARAAAATRGPWLAELHDNPPNELGRANNITKPMQVQHVVTEWEHGQLKSQVLINGTRHSPYFERNHVSDMEPADADFIAHSREDVPALCQALRAAMTENERLINDIRQVRQGMQCNCDEAWTKRGMHDPAGTCPADWMVELDEVLVRAALAGGNSQPPT